MIAVYKARSIDLLFEKEIDLLSRIKQYCDNYNKIIDICYYVNKTIYTLEIKITEK